MADDDRYRWLDKEVAERLLRGSSADELVNARNSTRKGRPATPERIAAVLDALVTQQTAMRYALGAGYANRPPQPQQLAELQGEAAAVEAFRVAYAEVLHGGPVDITAGPTESSTVVGRRAVRENRGRSGERDRRPGAARRASLAGRPLRAGFAMAVAGCALGGVAVAAGTGVLPSPFGGGGSPATSVSPLESPSAAGGEAAAGGDNAGSGSSPGRHGSSSADSRDGGLAENDRNGHGKGNGSSKDRDNGRPGADDISEADKQAIARALCLAYEQNTLSQKDRKRLERAAGGPEGVAEFCAAYAGNESNSESGGSASSGGVGAPGDSGGTSDSGGSGDADGEGDSGGDGDGDDSDADGGATTGSTSGSTSGGENGGDSGGDADSTSGDAGGGDSGGDVSGDSGADVSGESQGTEPGQDDGQLDGSTPESEESAPTPAPSSTPATP